MPDSANYNTGTVTITKSVTVPSIPGAVGSVIAPAGQSAIQVNASNAVVALRNLVIVPLGSNSVGVDFLNGKGLAIDRCSLSNLAIGVSLGSAAAVLSADALVSGTRMSSVDTGIVVTGPADARFRVTVADTEMRDVAIDGIRGETGLELTVTNSRIIGRGRNPAQLLGTGINLRSSSGFRPIGAHIANSLVSSFYRGVYTEQSAPFVSVSVTGSELAHNGTAAYANGGWIALGGSRVLHNDVGTAGAGTIFTSGTNYFAFNGNDGVALAGPGGVK